MTAHYQENCSLLHSVVLGDPEAIEYGDFDNVYHECKDSCPHKRSSHHE